MYKSIIIIITMCSIMSVNAGTLRVVTAHPCQRSMAEMITDTYNQRVIMFGGQDYGFSGRYLNDIWALDLNSETWQFPTMSQPMPSPRRNAALAYDSVNNRMLLFGGRMGSTFYNDIWACDLTIGAEYWLELTPSGTPPSHRTEVTGIIDPLNNRLILFGGDGYSGRNNETWELDLTTMTWSMLSPSGSLPSARSAYSAVYDPIGHRMLVFSGAASPITNDLWSLDLTYGNENWQALSPGGNIPQGRAQPFCAYDAANNRLITGFGFDYPGYLQFLNDAWALDIDSLFWRRILAPGIVYPRRGACAAYNGLNEKIFIFGGDNGGSSAELYSLTTDTLAISENVGTNIMISPYIQIISNPSRLPLTFNVSVPIGNKMTLSVIDISGRTVAVFADDETSLGKKNIHWDGRDMQGRKVPAGTYFIHLKINGESVTQKAVVIE